MYLRVGYLWSILVALTLLVSYQSMNHDQLASFGFHALHDDALTVVRTRGALGLYLTCVAVNIGQCLPYIAGGLFLGLLCRFVGFLRKVRRRRASARIHHMIDRFGVRISMHYAPLEHDPNVRELKLGSIDTSKLPAATSPLEIEALRLLAAHRNVPADLDGHHATTLAHHTYRVWQLACKKFGAGSIEAQLSVCHDLGKILAYAKDESNKWVIQGNHRPLALQIVRDLDAFTAMQQTARCRFMDIFTALQTGAIPVDFSERERSLLRLIKHVDFKSTAQEKELKKVQEASESDEEPEHARVVDASELRDLLASNIFEVLEKMNINRSLDSGGTLEGVFVDKSKVLFLPEKAIRKRIAEILPEEIKSPLGLTQTNVKGVHPARNTIVKAIQLLFDTYDIFDDKAADDGVFRIQCAMRTLDDVIAIKVNNFPETLTRTWGKWKHEIDIL